MKTLKLAALSLLLFATHLATGQTAQPIALNKEYKDVKIDKSANLNYQLSLKKGGLYKISVLQQDVDVILVLSDKDGKKILDHDSPNGQNGYEVFEYKPAETANYLLAVKRLDEAGNPEYGKVTVLIKEFTKAEIQLRAKIKRELEPENAKVVQTLDIDHFWEAFDHLKTCKTRTDSVHSFQALYLDRATDGLLDFMEARQFTAEKFASAVAKYPKFYNSVRKNTYEVKKAVPLINEVFEKFKALYPNFKPFKVCFAIGTVNTGGTVSNNFVLIGTEITTSTADVDLSEINNSAFRKVLASHDNIVQKIKSIVSHECVHTQQKTPLDKDAIGCPVLNNVMKEGFCDFIGELVAGDQINKVAQTYGDQHEKELWKQLKGEMCSGNSGNWLYNYSTVKDEPADLGYYMGYKIAQEYYRNAIDKRAAVRDIIEMSNPVRFLELSKYDQKEKK